MCRNEWGEDVLQRFNSSAPVDVCLIPSLNDRFCFCCSAELLLLVYEAVGTKRYGYGAA